LPFWILAKMWFLAQLCQQLWFYVHMGSWMARWQLVIW
jgi:hypothetical protein